jgi:ATP-dependent Clp protease ATP-binding subunit ClpX
MEYEAIVFIYSRKEAKKDDDLSAFTYEPIGVSKGKIIMTDEGETFIDSKCGAKYSSISDISSINDKYVYAFQYPLSDLSTNDKKRILNKLSQQIEELHDYLIFQIYYEGQQSIQTFATSNEVEKFVEVNTDYYEGIEEMKNANYKNCEGEENTEKDETSTALVELSVVKSKGPIIYSDDIYESVSKTVICQDSQIKEIATTIAKNQRLTDNGLKSNLLVCGPTGVGKTEIFRCISEYSNIPIAIEDSSEYTAPSYKGKDVSEMLVHLYENADRDIEKAQRGILVLDEIDKKATNNREHATYTSAVIESLLKMMEGHVYSLPVSAKEEIRFDTSMLSFAFLGAFSGIEKFTDSRKVIGFGTRQVDTDTKSNKDIYTSDTLKKYGLIPEFIGRANTIVVMDNLEVPELKRIIIESDKSQLMLYKRFFENIGIDFQFDDETLYEIATEAHKLGLGARGIKTIVENALAVANYYALSRGNYRKLIINPKTIKDNTNYKLF